MVTLSDAKSRSPSPACTVFGTVKAALVVLPMKRAAPRKMMSPGGGGGGGGGVSLAVYDTRRTAEAPLSTDLATRTPEPVRIKASALPGAHPGRSVTSLTSDLRSDVRWAAPASALAQVGGFQLTDACVRGRALTLPGLTVNVGVLSAATARDRGRTRVRPARPELDGGVGNRGTARNVDAGEAQPEATH